MIVIEKLFKILTIVSFLIITTSGEHISAPFGLFIIFGLFSGGIETLKALFYVVIIVLIIVSTIVRFSHKEDLLIFISSGLFFCIPIVMRISYLENEVDTMFYTTAGIFVIIYSITLFKIYNRKSQLISDKA